jgi:hypothetical protein
MVVSKFCIRIYQKWTLKKKTTPEDHFAVFLQQISYEKKLEKFCQKFSKIKQNMFCQRKRFFLVAVMFKTAKHDFAKLLEGSKNFWPSKKLLIFKCFDVIKKTWKPHIQKFNILLIENLLKWTNSEFVMYKWRIHKLQNICFYNLRLWRLSKCEKRKRNSWHFWNELSNES